MADEADVAPWWLRLVSDIFSAVIFVGCGALVAPYMDSSRIATLLPAHIIVDAATLRWAAATIVSAGVVGLLAAIGGNTPGSLATSCLCVTASGKRPVALGLALRGILRLALLPIVWLPFVSSAIDAVFDVTLVRMDHVR